MLIKKVKTDYFGVIISEARGYIEISDEFVVVSEVTDE